MPRSYAEFYQRKQKFLSNQVEDGHVSVEDARAIRECCDAFDEDKPTTKRPHWPDAPSHLTKYRSESTLANWMYFLTQYAIELDEPLLETTARTLNQVAEDWLNGTTDHKDDSISKGTIRAYQNSARIFYRYHDTPVTPKDIAVFETNDSSINPRDMLTPEEAQRVRDAPEHPRDKAIVYMLMYTGLRNNGLRTLRVKDVDVENEEWYFNTTSDHLKNIYRENAPRPLLGATPTVRDWLDYHPYANDPDAYFIVGKPKYGNVDPYEPVSDRTIQRVLDTVKETADVNKPLHPHMIRHNFVSICKREYDLDSDTIKFLIGHTPDSNVMETTYSHLSGEDYKEKAEVGAGIRDPDEDSSFTPDHCKTCGEPLGPNAKACERCGTIYTPDAKATLDKLEDELFDDATDTTDEQQKLDVSEYREFVEDNPELARKLYEEASD